MLRDRFRAPLDPGALALSASTEVDGTLLPYDLWGSLAHARMLGETGVLPRASAGRIRKGLLALGARAAAGKFPLDPALEDVHLNVEVALTRNIGEDGARLHTGRSRNDQVALDLALYERDALLTLEESCAGLADALLRSARAPHGRNVVAGWTHLQPAQAVYWAQLLGTHALRFVRDGERFARIRAGISDSPLGAGALAGSSLPIDRIRTARWLGFARPSRSSIDSVSDRDPLVETIFASTVALVHAGALAEELVLGSMEGVERVHLHDAYVTTSSLMPHKRNPDLAELLRAEGGPAIGHLTSVLGVLKGLPIGYQRDLQATKPILIEAVGRTTGALGVLTGMVATTGFRPDPVRPERSTASVEIADALVRAGVPFRRAHSRVARFLARPGATAADGAGSPEFKAAFPELSRTGYRTPSFTEEPERRRSTGGSAWAEVAVLLGDTSSRVRRLRSSASRERRRLQRLRAGLGIPLGWRFVGGDERPRPG